MGFVETEIAAWIFRAAGVFYAAGALLIATALKPDVGDTILAALSSAAERRAARERRLWLGGGAIVTMASGLALALLWEGAAALFVLGVLQQAVYLGWAAPRRLDPDDPPDADGRRSTVNAFSVYAVVGAAVVAAWAQGALLPTERIATAPMLVAAGGFLAFATHLGLRLRG